jgi:hypothetical protein
MRGGDYPLAATAPENINLVERITANMGRSFVKGVQALAPTIVGATRHGGGGTARAAKGWGGKCTQKTMSPPLRDTVGSWIHQKSPTYGILSNKREKSPLTDTTYESP